MMENKEPICTGTPFNDDTQNLYDCFWGNTYKNILHRKEVFVMISSQYSTQTDALAKKTPGLNLSWW